MQYQPGDLARLGRNRPGVRILRRNAAMSEEDELRRVRAQLDLSRRQFLQRAAILGVGAASLPLLAACTSSSATASPAASAAATSAASAAATAAASAAASAA